jgi:hypothetical protein
MLARGRGALVGAALCLVLISAVGVTLGCGDDEPEKPTSVSEADLQKDGEFWRSLTPDLKDQLVEAGQQRLGQERPDGATEIDAIETSELVTEIDKQYSNEGKRSQTIYETYVMANDTIAREQFEELAPELEGGAP